MRKSLFLIMLATAAMPALAAAPGEDRGGDRRAARAEQNERGDGKKAQRVERAERAQRAERPQRVERAQRAASAQPVARVQRTQRAERGVAVVDRGSTSSRYAGRSSYGSRRNTSQGTINLPNRYTNGQYGGATSTRDSDRNRDGDRYRDGDRRRDGDRYRDSDGRRDGRYRDGDRDGRRWSGDWRRDNRYDWRHYRSRYSNIYRLGRYHDPYRYGYRRFSIGLFLGAGYYGNNYWLNDPWQYRLPPAYGPYRWVRYYNDALLVNIYSGEVVDVIYGFFW